MSVYKSKYTGEQMDSLFDIIESKKEILQKLSLSDEGDLLYDNKKITLELVAKETEATE